jgi:hypothetical protein
MKKLLALVLVLVLSISAIACTSKNSEKKPVTSGTSDVEVTTPGKTETEIKPNLPEVTYDGRDFRVHMQQGKDFEFFIEEDSENAIKSALWKRNVTVEDEYDVEIKPVYNETTGTLYSHVDEIITFLFAEEDTFDITATMVAASGRLVLNDALVDWSTQKYNQLNAKWWLSGANKQFEIYGSIYTAVGSTCITALRYTYAMMYNKTMGDRLNEGEGITSEVYDAIDNMTWNIDYFTSIVSKVYNDIDDVNGPSDGDQYGFVAENLTNLDVYSQAFNLPMLAPSETDGIVFVYPSERLYMAVDKVITLYQSNGSRIFDTAGLEGYSFIHNNALFATMRIETAIGGGLEIMEDVYTILPYPMLDENQENYNSGVMDNYTVLGLYKLAPDYEFASIITEALNIEAMNILYPAYYDEALCKKYVTDERYVEMVDIVLEGRRFDMGTLFQENLSRVSMMFRDVVRSGRNVMKDYIDSSSENVNTGITNIIDAYKNNRG